jgi:hypothetical protein
MTQQDMRAITSFGDVKPDAICVDKSVRDQHASSFIDKVVRAGEYDCDGPDSAVFTLLTGPDPVTSCHRATDKINELVGSPLMGVLEEKRATVAFPQWLLPPPQRFPHFFNCGFG